jgi:ABC-type multidrug transport system ATPase subunit
MMSLLGLTEAADTIVGDAMLRGISGGQKRRVTIGEMLFASPRVLLLDEITTGLDSNTALHIMAALQRWVQETRGVVVATLLQPLPEVFEMFDRVGTEAV